MQNDGARPTPGGPGRSAPITSYAALGDSFTEGLNDPGPGGNFAGWADRLARLLAERRPVTASGHYDLRYANLAVRGRLLDQIVAEQVPQVEQLQPDLVSICAGGNDILRPGTDPDEVAERFERAIELLTPHAGRVLIFTGFDTRATPVLKHLRGKIAIYNSNLRAIADRHDLLVADLWGLRSVQDRRAWSEDRLHLSPQGHQRVAELAARALGVPADDPEAPWPHTAPHSSAELRRENIQWAREFLLPWVGRRVRGESSGDRLTAKRPEPELIPR
ncbi:SGNH hydrolase [Kitasatospora sp. MMS16-BH015]|uniref:SGNH/GDSL hydrolase family protein n=1 Tax=Kitasatospora sp. MMS16-BH015 TaxID=2018025 RepID=UPI000CA33620|nr:SGNH/GDSL hydrolase family protein [Kitasatospora sp. MMS16-BH015]AUG79312.1 SGNH hydrolase [Kitasatospora sp. MMS16-BH015]